MTIKTPPEFTKLTDLANSHYGSKILFATDEWFAVASNLINQEDPVFIASKFTTFGKWMDGWETRRKRIPGHDWCIIRLAFPGFIEGVEFDTAHFTGNYAPKVSLQGGCFDEDPSEFLELENQVGTMGSFATPNDMDQVNCGKSENWEVILPQTELQPGYPDTRHNYFSVQSKKRWTHIRLNIFPDGGIARLHIYGRVVVPWERISSSQIVDLASLANGGSIVAVSNAHFGTPNALLAPGRGINMGDGWETARKVTRPSILVAKDDGMLDVPGNDWAIIKLGIRGIIKLIEVDTLHFKGNYPESCLIEACCVQNDLQLDNPVTQWKVILPRTKLQAHQQHFFSAQEQQLLVDETSYTHVRLFIYPDGGISRFRVYGTKGEF